MNSRNVGNRFTTPILIVFLKNIVSLIGGKLYQLFNLADDIQLFTTFYLSLCLKTYSY